MPRDPRMGKARSGPKEKAAGRTITRARNASRCKLCGLGEDILPTPNTVPDAPLDRRLLASRHLQPRTRIAVQPLSQSLCGRGLLPAAPGLGSPGGAFSGFARLGGPWAGS